MAKVQNLDTVSGCGKVTDRAKAWDEQMRLANFRYP